MIDLSDLVLTGKLTNRGTQMPTKNAPTIALRPMISATLRGVSTNNHKISCVTYQAIVNMIVITKKIVVCE